MAQCEFCGARTGLYYTGIAICVECSNHFNAAEKPTEGRGDEVDLHRLEKALLENLRAAQERYFNAQRHERCFDVGGQFVNACDGQSVLEHASDNFAEKQPTEHLSIELEKYTEALDAFADFMMQKELPEF